MGGAGTVCHMGGRSRLPMWLEVDVVLFTLTFDSSPIKETFAKLNGTVIIGLDS